MPRNPPRSRPPVCKVNEALRSLLVPIDSVTLDPANARAHGDKDLRALAASLDTFGQQKPFVVVASGRGKRTVIAGNGGVLAAQKLGWTHVAVVAFPDAARARAYALADNRTAELSAWNDEALLAALEDVRDRGQLDATGFTTRDLDALVRDCRPPVDDDAFTPDTARTPTSKLGERYELGAHVLVCGDCTDAAVVAGLMGSAAAEMVWTDPPYGVDYVGKTKRALTIKNDGPAGLGALLVSAFSVLTAAVKPGGAFYVAGPAGPPHYEFQSAIRAAGWRPHQTLVWRKDRMVLGHSDYHWQHEFIDYGWTPGPGRSGRRNHDGSRWRGDHAAVSVLDVPCPKRSEEHPTMKPVALVMIGIENSSSRGDIVFDGFGGSGTTLIACAETGRVPHDRN